MVNIIYNPLVVETNHCPSAYLIMYACCQALVDNIPYSANFDGEILTDTDSSNI